MNIRFTLCKSLLVSENGKFDTYTVLLLGARPPLIFFSSKILPSQVTTRDRKITVIDVTLFDVMVAATQVNIYSSRCIFTCVTFKLFRTRQLNFFTGSIVFKALNRHQTCKSMHNNVTRF